jgi:hypothetical protein
MGWTSEGWWFYSWQEQRQRVETGSGAHPLRRVPGPLSLWVKRTRVMVTTHLYLVQSLRIIRALSAFSYMPSCVHRDNFISAHYWMWTIFCELLLHLERAVLRNEIECKYLVWTYILIQLFRLIELASEYCCGLLSKRECIVAGRLIAFAS